jgi:predicted enzyme related to lactoylglutathione lyase
VHPDLLRSYLPVATRLGINETRGQVEMRSKPLPRGSWRIERPPVDRVPAVSRDDVSQPVPEPGSRSTLSLIEFPADDPQRARRFWTDLLGVQLEVREAAAGEGWQTSATGPAVGVHSRGSGPGDSYSLPYFAVSDIPAALAKVRALGGSVVHPGEQWAICKDSEGSPFGLSREPF